MIMLLKFSNFPDEISENDELREFELSGSDCMYCIYNCIRRNHVPGVMAKHSVLNFHFPLRQ